VRYACLVCDVVEPTDEFTGTAGGHTGLPGKPANAAFGQPFAVLRKNLLLVGKRHLL
jgi:hypothetical protein